MTKIKVLLWAGVAWFGLAVGGVLFASVGCWASPVCCGLMVLPAGFILSQLGD